MIKVGTVFIISVILFVNIFIILGHGTYYIADGTFKIAPRGIQQMYTIHSRMNHNDPFTPCAYALMERKTSAAYEDVFEALKDKAITLGYTLNPENFSTDYELAAIQAIKKCFPNTQLAGCLFHFAQICWRKVQQSQAGIDIRKLIESELRTEFHMLIALAFIPVSDISSTFDMLMGNLDSRLIPLAEPLNEYYIHGAKLGKTIIRQPKFCPS